LLLVLIYTSGKGFPLCTNKREVLPQAPSPTTTNFLRFFNGIFLCSGLPCLISFAIDDLLISWLLLFCLSLSLSDESFEFEMLPELEPN